MLSDILSNYNMPRNTSSPSAPASSSSKILAHGTVGNRVMNRAVKRFLTAKFDVSAEFYLMGMYRNSKEDRVSLEICRDYSCSLLMVRASSSLIRMQMSYLTRYSLPLVRISKKQPKSMPRSHSQLRLMKIIHKSSGKGFRCWEHDHPKYLPYVELIYRSGNRDVSIGNEARSSKGEPLAKTEFHMGQLLGERHDDSTIW